MQEEGNAQEFSLFQEKRKPRVLPVDEANISKSPKAYKAKQRTTGFARGHLSREAQEIDPQTRVLAACRHGRTRSKATFAVLRGLGYEKVSILGITDAGVEKEEKMRLIEESQIILCAQGDIVGEVRILAERMGIDLSEKEILNLELTARDHWVLGSENLSYRIRRKSMDKIKRKLISLGFVSREEK